METKRTRIAGPMGDAPLGNEKGGGKGFVGRILTRYSLIERRNSSLASLAVLVTVAVAGYGRVVPDGIAVGAVAAVVLLELVRRLDSGLPLVQIAAVVATLQWLVGAWLSFHVFPISGRYGMYVPPETYFGFAVPGTALYCAGLLAAGGSPRQKLLVLTIDRRHFVAMGVLLNIIAIAADAASRGSVRGLAFFIELCSQLRYVGALYFLLSTHPWRNVFAVASCIRLVVVAGSVGLFHDMILWLTLLSCYWYAERSRPILHRTIFVVFGLCFVWAVQIVKQDYRTKQSLGVPATVLAQAIETVLSPEKLLNPDSLTVSTARLNQGWIVSAVMDHVPKREPFAQGETLRDAIRSALVPRVLWPDKKGAGGRENFRRFTGLPLADETSMGISPLGEAYANFGADGGLVFMSAYGLAFAMVYRLVLRYVVRSPEFLLWLPLIFYQAVKAETELVVVLNQITKGTIVALAGYYGVSWLLQRRVVFRRQRLLTVGRLVKTHDR